MQDYYIKLADVLDLLTPNDICVYKSSYLRKKIAALPVIFVDEREHIIWIPTEEGVN